MSSAGGAAVEDAAAKRRKLERKLREVVEENNRLKDELTRARYKIKKLSSAKNRILDHMNRADAADSESDDSDMDSLSAEGEDVSADDGNMSDLSIDEGPLLDLDGGSPPPFNLTPFHRGTSSSNKRTHDGGASPSSPSLSSTAGGSSGGGKKRQRGGEKDKNVQIKRLPFSVQYDANGNPVLPIKIGVLRVTNLGTVRADLPAYHSTRYIWPVGYESIRQYASMISASSSVDYICRIVEGPENVPMFEIHPSDQPDVVITHQSPTGAWTAVLRAANKLRNKETSNSASGPDYFGFAHPVVAKLIQELPGADQCANYIRQEFIEFAGGSGGQSGAASGGAPKKGKAKGAAATTAQTTTTLATSEKSHAISESNDEDDMMGVGDDADDVKVDVD